MLDDLKNLKEYATEYIDIRISQIKLQAAESVSRLISGMLKLILAIFLGTFVLLFLSLTAAFYLSSVLYSEILGFLFVALFYVLLLIIFFLFRKSLIEKPVIRSVIHFFYSKPADNETEIT